MPLHREALKTSVAGSNAWKKVSQKFQPLETFIPNLGKVEFCHDKTGVVVGWKVAHEWF